MHSEFALIARHFDRNKTLHHATLGVGDDCALMAPLAGEQLAISSDMLVAGRHFFDDVSPETLGHKALAVNLSDLAACAAQARCFTLALALPAVDDDWLAAFARGMFALADASGCELIGGDTTCGPLTINITVLGSVPCKAALLRSGAQVGDDIYVTHTANTGLGDARMALHLLRAQRDPAQASLVQNFSQTQQHMLLESLRPRLEQPTPRLGMGLALRGKASSCIDLSDGLCGDLQHVLTASGLGATLYASAADGSGLEAATSPVLRQAGQQTALEYALAGGDDYELLFTAAPAMRKTIATIAAQTGTCATRIGYIEERTGLRWADTQGNTHVLQGAGFDHFAS